MTTGSSSILPFAQGTNANVVTDAQWQTLVNSGSLSTGFVQGLAQSAQVNKALRQTSSLSAGLAQWLANKGNSVTDSLTPDEIASMIELGLKNSITNSSSSSYIKAWQSDVASNGGYPKYAVVADPVNIGVLYLSTVADNTVEPSATSPVSEWLILPPNRVLSVECFGVVHDPNNNYSTQNTTAMQNAVDAINALSSLAAGSSVPSFTLYIPAGYNIYINSSLVFTQPVRMIIDGTLLPNETNFTYLLQFTGANQSYLGGIGTVLGQNTLTPIYVSCEMIIENINVQNGSPYGIYVNSAFVIIKDIDTNGNETDLYLSSNFIEVKGGFYTAGIQFGSGGLTTISDAEFKFCSNTCITSTATNGNPLNNITIRDCYFYQNEAGCINFTSNSSGGTLSSITITDCTFFQNGQSTVAQDIYLSYVSDAIINDNIFEGTCNSNTSMTSGQTISGLYVDGNSSYVVVKGNIFKNIGALNSVNGYGIHAVSTQYLTIDDNTFINSKGTMIAPTTGTMVESWYIGKNTWNAKEFLSSSNVTNNPQNGLGIPFINVTDGFPTTLQTDIIRKSFNLSNLTQPQNWDNSPGGTNIPKSIIACKTNIGWVAEQMIARRADWTGGTEYWLVPFLDIWPETATITLRQSNGSYIQVNIIFSLSILTTEGMGLDSYIASNLSSDAPQYMGHVVKVKGLVDIQKVINLTSINQYYPTSS